jgi:peroxiredoxin Q/BCP
LSIELSVGDLAPDFTLPSTTGDSITLTDHLQGKQVILYFYPRDNTSGCTQEAIGFRDHYERYQAHGIQILGVSPDSLSSHLKFSQKYQLPFPLLADDEATVAKAYGVYGPKKMMGKTYNGIHRTTFLIGSDQRIEQVYRKVKVASHATDILLSLGSQ